MKRSILGFQPKGLSFISHGTWLLATALLASGFCFAAILSVRLQFNRAMVGVAALCFSAYMCGYAQSARRRDLYVPLVRLKRQQYSEVWDALAASRSDAFRSVSGGRGEKELRRSALPTIEDLVELLSIGVHDDVLEIGCGVGRIGHDLAPRCLSWTGADISANMVDHASIRMCGIRNVRLVHLQKGGLEEFEENSFDVVYATNIFPHLDEIDRWRYVQEAFRVLRPAGRIFIDNIDIESDNGWAIFVNDARRYQSLERPPYMPRFSTAAELMAYATRAGFERVRSSSRSSLVIVTAAKPTQ